MEDDKVIVSQEDVEKPTVEPSDATPIPKPLPPKVEVPSLTEDLSDGEE